MRNLFFLFWFLPFVIFGQYTKNNTMSAHAWDFITEPTKEDGVVTNIIGTGNGTLQNFGTTTWTADSGLKWIASDGNDKVSYSDLDLVTGIFIEIVYSFTTPVDNAQRRLCDKSGAYLVTKFTDNHMRFYCYPGGVAKYCDVNFTHTANQFIYIAAVWHPTHTGGYLELWFNGAEGTYIAQQNGASNISNNANGMFGGNDQGSNFTHKGWIKYFSIGTAVAANYADIILNNYYYFQQQGYVPGTPPSLETDITGKFKGNDYFDRFKGW